MRADSNSTDAVPRLHDGFWRRKEGNREGSDRKLTSSQRTRGGALGVGLGALLKVWGERTEPKPLCGHQFRPLPPASDQGGGSRHPATRREPQKDARPPTTKSPVTPAP
jgi:hypothetical protein